MRNRFAAVLLGSACLIAASAFADDTKPVVVFFATGGTIAMKIDPIKHAPVPAISGEDLLATVPDVAKYARVEVNNLSNIPSDYMDPPRWMALTRAVEAALAKHARGGSADLGASSVGGSVRPAFGCHEERERIYHRMSTITP